MASGRSKDNHEELRVHVEQAKREVLPAVVLETKEIKMTIKPPTKTVPSIVMTTFDDSTKHDISASHNADRIVGITVGPQGIETTFTKSGVPPVKKSQNVETSETRKSRPTTQQTPPSPKLGSRLTAEQTSSIIEKTEDLMEYFEDQKKTQGLQKRTSAKKPRTPSPSPVRQSIGLDHLDNLVRLMEQLGNLRDENSRLKNKCDYLESTKTLLQAKSSLEDGDDLVTYQSNSLPRTKKSKSQSTKSSSSDGGKIRYSRPRLPSAEDAKCLEIDFDDSSSDQGTRPKSAMYKRSFSTGSLEVPSDIMEQSGEDELGSQVILHDPFQKQVPSKISKSPEAKRKSKFSKWAKVKKVLTKQQLSENISSGIKSIKGFGKGAYMRYGSVSSRELVVPSGPSVAESRSVDSGVGSGMDGELQDVRKSTSSGEPPSPTRFMERHIDVPTPQVDDCMGIWLGPPEWIEKEREKEQQILKQSGLSDSPKSDPGDLTFEQEGEKYLSVPRRQSSPMLLDSNDEGEEDDPPLRRSSSYKGQESVKDLVEAFRKSEKGEKKHKTPWGKMKTIIHTRKDSGKKKHSKSEQFQFEEISDMDLEQYEEMSYLEGPVSRSTPKTSPVVFRQKQQEKSASNSPPGKGKEPAAKLPLTATDSLDVSALLAGGVTDEFTRKLQEWEELKGKRSSGNFKDSQEFSESVSYESAGAVSPEFLKKIEEWEKVKALKGLPVSERKVESQVEADAGSSSDEMEEISTPPERQRQSVNLEEVQRKLTDSFSRKMEEWEKQKYRRQYSQAEVTQKTGGAIERQKSKKTKEEKEKEKYEKLRERELHRVEREQQKLDKERMRIEKERLKALEREAKIEKMKGRLSQPDMESKFKNPVLSPLTEYKVTADFARKLHEWELKKGKDVSTAMYLEAQKRSLQFSMEYQNAANILSKNGEGGVESTDTDDAQMRKTSSESDDMFLMDESETEKSDVSSKLAKGQKPPPLTLIPYLDLSPEVSPGMPGSDDSSLDEHTTATTESMTQANITSLEKANRRLLAELRHKELEYNTLQEEVRDLNDRLVNFRNEHALELDVYRQQLLEKSPPHDVSLETQHMSQTLVHLEDKIDDLKKFGEQLAMSMEGAAVGKFQTVEGAESINIRLVDLLDKMRLLLQQATISGENTIEEVSQKSSALHNFEKLYSQAMQLQVQMNNLRLSQLERNKEIMNMKRHLLLQEANNLLLQADVTRREAELLYYKEYSQKRTPIKRWNTYSGKEDRARVTLPVPGPPQKESIFQRVQRLRSARPIISSTTDSDSDVPTKSPPKRESPRIRKRESPKTRRKESPKVHKRESPSSRRRESPTLKKRESPKPHPHPIVEVGSVERSTDRKEEHMVGTTIQVLPEIKEGGERGMHFSTVTLPTARVSLPKDISPHEMNGVPRRLRDKGGTPSSKSEITHVPAREMRVENVKTEKDMSKHTKAGESRFAELLIPEWKKNPDSHRKIPLQRTSSFDGDDGLDDVFIDNKDTNIVSETIILPSKAHTAECVKPAAGVDRSFDSSASEDTLKYLSPEASPAPKVEPPLFPVGVRLQHQSPHERNETVSDPGQSRPTSVIKLSVGTPVLLRKPPSGQPIRGTKLNIPVIPLRRIKPAQELLEDSQKYRSGHSIYLTRILKRYPMKIECRSRSLEDKRNADKENIKEGFVKAMVKQISREGTPDSKSSSKSTPKGGSSQSIQKTESPKSEFIQHIVHKLSQPCGPTTDKASAPLKDLTNDGQVRMLKEAFTNGSQNGAHEGMSVDSFSHRNGGSLDVIYSSQSSSSASTVLTVSQLGNKMENGSEPESKVTYASMPMLSLEGEESMRERSATTSRSGNGSSPSPGYSYSPKDSPSQRHKIHVAVSMSPGRSRRIIDPAMSPARMRRLIDPASPGRRRRVHEPSPIEQVIEERAEPQTAQTTMINIDLKDVQHRSPKPRRKDKSKMGTIGILCRQSLTLDLGVGFEGASVGGQEEGRSQTLPVRHSQSSTTSTSSQSEIENIPTTSDEKKKSKSRHRFLDSTFIQKSRKFFKVSKENRCPALECCGSDREMCIHWSGYDLQRLPSMSVKGPVSVAGLHRMLKGRSMADQGAQWQIKAPHRHSTREEFTQTEVIYTAGLSTSLTDMT